jgi:signal transduction histidine kinase
VYIITIFFAINIISTLGIIYFLMESFLKKQEELRIELRKSLENLKATQKQLIQREKMASLGELTAGIAHEIQNPLNFVNNFSEVSAEFIEELKEARTKMDGERDKALEEELLDNIEQNLQKILHHGRRADSIVKGMLQHSRSSTGQKEWIHINALVDESLRLCYHGLRAKDKAFIAELKTDFDAAIEMINVVPQDISRVLLNLCNNAFYAVNEKKEASTLKGENYEPMVWVTTKRTCTPSGAEDIEIVVKDNGTGIPQSIADKIFQPFFTTKPTGQGTGLGLSLSYDIIKAHGGELKVESKEGQGSAFIISLPLKA